MTPILARVLILLSCRSLYAIEDSDFEIRAAQGPSVTVEGIRGQTVELKGIYFNTSIYERGSDDAVEAYLGIPYATKPTGTNRFKETALRPVHTLGSKFNATRWKPGCMQEFGVFTNDTKNFSEDCLYLNIWKRRGTSKNDLRPVVVVIHGGGYIAGDGHEYDWRGPQMAFFEDLVVVNFNYRLGVFGFLDLGLPDAAGHQGHLDQVLALKWINQNIKFFGGDPERVALFGVSAGSFSISWHLFSGFSSGLFHAAVIDAGVLTHTQAETQRDHVSRAERMVKASVCKDLKESGPDQVPKQQRQKILNCLMRTDADELVKLQEQYGASQTYTFRPTFNNQKYLPRSPTCMTNEKAFAVTVPIIIGDTTNEGLFLLTHRTHDPLPSFSNFDEVLEWDIDILKGHHTAQAPNYGPDNSTIRSIYDTQSNDVTPDPDTLLNNAAQIIGDGLFVCPVMNFADRYSSVQPNVYFYRWERLRINETFPNERENGAYHGLMFYTGSGSQYLYLKGQMAEADKSYIQNTIKMIADFASNPTGSLSFNGTNLQPHSADGAVNDFEAGGLTVLQTHPKTHTCNTVWPVFAESNCTKS